MRHSIIKSGLAVAGSALAIAFVMKAFSIPVWVLLAFIGLLIIYAFFILFRLDDR